MGVAVFTPRFRLLAVNRQAEGLWDLAAQAEFGSREAAQRAFVESCKSERDKPRWFARIVAPQGATVLITVHAGATEWNGEPALVYVLAPEAAAGTAAPGVHAYGELRVDEACITVMYGRTYVHVTATEFRLLAALCARPWHLHRKDRLLRDLWGVRAGNTRTLDVTINRLRAKLKEHGFPELAVRTVHGQGYLFDPTPLVAEA